MGAVNGFPPGRENVPYQGVCVIFGRIFLRFCGVPMDRPATSQNAARATSCRHARKKYFFYSAIIKKVLVGDAPFLANLRKWTEMDQRFHKDFDVLASETIYPLSKNAYTA